MPSGNSLPQLDTKLEILNRKFDLLFNFVLQEVGGDIDFINKIAQLNLSQSNSPVIHTPLLLEEECSIDNEINCNVGYQDKFYQTNFSSLAEQGKLNKFSNNSSHSDKNKADQYPAKIKEVKNIDNDGIAKCFPLPNRLETSSIVQLYKSEPSDQTISFTSRIEINRNNKNEHNQGVKRSSCNICGKTFHATKARNQHMKIHTDPNAFKCDTCGKGFTASGTLKIHQRIHTKEKPYKCDICARSFARPCYLRNHS